MADPWAQFSTKPPETSQGLVIDITPQPTPQTGTGDPWGAFATAPPPTSPSVVASGTQQAPPQAGPQSLLDTGMDAVNTGVNWLGTQATKAATGFAGTGRALADTNKAVVDALGLPPAVATAANILNPVTAAGQFAPSSEQLNRGIFDNGVAPEVKTPGPLGPAIDAGTQAALSTVAMPGSVVRNVLPAFTGGAGQEIAGNIPGIKGTKLEPLVRLLTGVGVGGATSLGQNTAGNIAQAVKNLAPNADKTAVKLIGRAAVNDKTTLGDILIRHGELGPGAPFVEAGGPNVRGLLRGSIAPPGMARTNAQEAFDARRGQIGDIAATALDKNISPNGSVSTTVDELGALRRQQATPAYEASGIPRRPATRITAMDEPPTWNTKQVTSPELEKLVQDSPDIRKALNTLRRFPDYKNLPKDSMPMWDEAYKLLGGAEQEAKRAGQNRKAMLIGDLRRDFQNALVDANPEYGRALKAYAGPSKLIDAAERGKEWFKPGVDDATVRREFQKLPEAEQEAARIGIRDWARSAMERTDKSASGVALWSSPANRAKLQAILKPGEYADLERQMNIVKNAAATATDINVGSRTAPMLAEQADIAAQANSSGLADLLLGRPVRAAAKFGSSALGRITEGKTEAVNAKVADYLTSTDAEKVGLVKSLAEKARLKELATQLARKNAVLSGGVAAPALAANSGGNR